MSSTLIKFLTCILILKCTGTLSESDVDDYDYENYENYQNYMDYLDEYEGLLEAPKISVGKRTAKTERSCAHCNCGVANSWTRIVGGWMTKVHEYPWMAALTRNGRVFCGGTLITEQFIMTAAHCVVRSVHDKSTEWVRESVRIVLAEHNTATVGETQTESLAVDRVFVHSSFSRATFDHDIALIKLARRVHFRHGLRTVCLPPKLGNYAGEMATVAGWGLTTEGGKPATSLMETKVPVLSMKQCRRRGYNATRITDNMICAGDHKRMDACQGDSGGSLLVSNRDQQMMAVGVVSWGEGCGRPRKPGVYARVDKHIDWILETTKDACYCY